MLADQDPLNLATVPPPEMSEGDNNVFEEASACATPASPRTGPMPGIVLTLDADDPPQEVVCTPPPGRHDSRSTARCSTRRKMQAQAQHRSPSSSRMNQNGHRKDPAYLKDPSGVSRSQSMRTARRPQSVDPTYRFRHRISSIPNDMTLPSNGLGGQRQNSNQSLPLPGDESDFTRLRNFAITNKGLVNRGDSFRSKSRSAHSVASMGGSGPLPLSAGLPKDDSSIDYPASTSYSQGDVASALVVETTTVAGAGAPVTITRNTRYKVLVVGAPDVGKTALTNQFMTSEYKCAYDISQDEEHEKYVAVVLNGSESELVFSEHQFVSDSVDNFTEMFSPDAYLVVYSVTSKRSLQAAKEALRLIHKWDNVDSKAVILVGNKTDLARHRVLSTDDGRSLAIEEGSKFIETSAGINHHVDELLVGILSQIRLKLSSMEKILQKRESVSLGSASGGVKLRGGKCPGCAGCKAKGILKRILKKACSRSKSCDNLHVL